MEEWNIQKRSASCCQCNTPFVEKAPCHTVLSFDPRGYQRKDFCRACWDALGGPLIREKAGVFSYWQGVYEPPNLSPDPLPREDAESIFRVMLKRQNPAEREAQYILAVMLERKRVLKHRETQLATEPDQTGQGKGPKKILVYEHQQTGEVFMITDPELRLDRLEDVQKRVAEMLRPASAPVASEKSSVPS